MQDSLPAGGLRLCREGMEPSGSLRKFSGYIYILLSRAGPVAMGVESNPHRSGRIMPASDQNTILPGLSPIRGREIEARFDGALMSSDGGLLVLREIEQRLGIARRLATCIRDPRAPERVVHGLDEIIRFRMLMIAAGYEDGNDADSLRADPLFKLAMDRLPEPGDLCSQSTVSRAENLPDRHALLRMGRALVDHYCQNFRQVPRRIVLDVDDTFDAVHGGQQLRLFNGHYDEYGFQPIVVFDGEGRMITALLRPACRPSGRRIVFWLRRLIAALRDNWPRVEILLRADSHYCTPEVLRFCRAERLDYVLGVAPTTTLRKHIVGLEASTTARPARAGGEKLRRFKEFYDGAASWDRVERIIARVEAGPQGVDTRFIVTSLDGVRGRTVYQDIYCPSVDLSTGCADGTLGQLRPWPGREPHQGLEDPSRRRTHLMLPRYRQPDAPVPAHRRLLADVEPTHRHAAAFSLAGGPVRYPSPAPDQARRQGRSAEAEAAALPAALDPEPAD